MIAFHCNRCGRESTDLSPELRSATRSVPTEDGSAELFYVCTECYPVSNGKDYRYCTRCGQETPPADLSGGRCTWCQAADDIPFDEPSDDAWSADKAARIPRPSSE